MLNPIQPGLKQKVNWLDFYPLELKCKKGGFCFWVSCPITL
jgi:hypothetical protein